MVNNKLTRKKLNDVGQKMSKVRASLKIMIVVGYFGDE